MYHGNVTQRRLVVAWTLGLTTSVLGCEVVDPGPDVGVANRCVLSSEFYVERIVPEFIQWQARGQTIGRYLVRLLTDEGERTRVKEKLGHAAALLGRRNAYREAAMQVRGYLQE